MCEAVAVFGFAAATLQLAKYGTSAFNQGLRFTNNARIAPDLLENWDDRVQAFNSLAARLEQYDNVNDQSFQRLLLRCKKEITTIGSTIQSLQNSAGSSRMKRLTKVCKTAWKEKEIDRKLASVTTLFETLDQIWAHASAHRVCEDSPLPFHEMNRRQCGQQIVNVSRDQDMLDSVDPTTLITFHKLGMELQQQSRFSDAEQILVHCLSYRCRILGAEHLSTLQSQINLAIVFQCQGRHAEAEKLYRATCQSFVASVGVDHTETLRAFQNFACFLREMSRYKEAETFAIVSADGMAATFGNTHTETLDALRNAAIILQWQKEFDRALPYAKRARDAVESCGEVTLADKDAFHKHVNELEENLNWVNYCVQYEDFLKLRTP